MLRCMPIVKDTKNSRMSHGVHLRKTVLIQKRTTEVFKNQFFSVFVQNSMSIDVSIELIACVQKKNCMSVGALV